MCRSIQPLFNVDPPATPGEVTAAARQYVRKISGYREPSAANRVAFDRALAEIAAATATLLTSLTTEAAPRSRAEEAAKARARSAKRFGSTVLPHTDPV